MKQFFILLFSCVFLNCSGELKSGNEVKIDEGQFIMNWPEDDDCNLKADPSVQDPIEFITSLKWRDCGELNSFFFLNSKTVPDDWVKKEHLPILISLLDNEELAFPVASIEVSTTYGFHGYTTIGRHAYHIIRTYQGAAYPYTTFSDSKSDTCKLTSVQKKSILDWWKTENK